MTFRGLLRVLVVDDYPGSSELLAALLASAGFDSRSCETAGQTLKVAREFQPHVVLLDIGLPDIDGCEVGERIKALDRTVMLIAITGLLDPQTRQAAEAAGFDMVLPKPTHPEVIVKLLDERLNELSISSA